VVTEFEIRKLEKFWKKTKSVVGWVQNDVAAFHIDEDDAEVVADSMVDILEMMFIKKYGNL